MPFRVQDFRAQLQYDGARPNLFQCDITFPTAVTGASAAQSKFTFMCRAASMPGDSIGQVPVHYFGREIKVAGNRTFPEWTVTIMNDEDYIVRDAFEKWMSGINSHAGNLRIPEFESGTGGYYQDAFITAYGKTGDVLKRMKLVGAWPMDLSQMEMDYGANDTIQEYAVTFAYQWWEWVDGQNGRTTDTVGSNLALSPLLPAIP